MTPAPLLVVGDTLLDLDLHGAASRLAPDAPVPVVDQEEVCARPGGGALAAAIAAADGREVTFVTALGDDQPGRGVAALLADAGVRVLDVGLDGATPEKLRVHAAGRPLVRIDRGGHGGPRAGALHASVRAALGWAETVLVSDYGRGMAAVPELRELLGRCERVVWDPHPRGPEPVAGAAVVTPNAAEAGAGGGVDDAVRRAGELRTAWRARAVCVTRGAGGAVLDDGAGAPLCAPAEPVAGDPCGAGDRFATRLAGALADGTPLRDAVPVAVGAASAWVAAGGARAWASTHASGTNSFGQSEQIRPAGPGRRVAGDLRDAAALAAATRAAGGTVVATGGCFDLLHAGHVATLRAARALGDCLIVLVNDDAAVRRLKGDGRPLNRAADRAALLAALDCVDAVAIFGEDTPAEALRAVRPHVWAKGGDYAGAQLPEADALAAWGGRAVILPLLQGRSTTRLIEEARCRPAS